MLKILVDGHSPTTIYHYGKPFVWWTLSTCFYHWYPLQKLTRKFKTALLHRKTNYRWWNFPLNQVHLPGWYGTPLPPVGILHPPLAVQPLTATVLGWGDTQAAACGDSLLGRPVFQGSPAEDRALGEFIAAGSCCRSLGISVSHPFNGGVATNQMVRNWSSKICTLVNVVCIALVMRFVGFALCDWIVAREVHELCI